MTSEEIQDLRKGMAALIRSDAASEVHKHYHLMTALLEIAYQLAVMNERGAERLDEKLRKALEERHWNE